MFLAFCPQHKCAACQKENDDPTYKCSDPSCGKFFHVQCVLALSLASVLPPGTAADSDSEEDSESEEESDEDQDQDGAEAAANAEAKAKAKAQAKAERAGAVLFSSLP